MLPRFYESFVGLAWFLWQDHNSTTNGAPTIPHTHRTEAHTVTSASTPSLTRSLARTPSPRFALPRPNPNHTDTRHTQPRTRHTHPRHTHPQLAITPPQKPDSLRPTELLRDTNTLGVTADVDQRGHSQKTTTTTKAADGTLTTSVL